MARTTPSKNDDVLDSRDIISRIDFLSRLEDAADDF